MASNMASALQYLHTRELIHGDVKSPNFMVYPGPPQPVGAAGAKGVAAQSLPAYTLKMSDHGLVEIKAALNTARALPGDPAFGTWRFPNWRAPELFEADAVPSHASDVYGLGCTLFELASHTFPWAGIPVSEASEIEALVRDGYRPERPEGCTDLFWEVVCKAWEGPPASRPAMADVNEELSRFLAAALSVEAAARAQQAVATETALAAVRELVIL